MKYILVVFKTSVASPYRHSWQITANPMYNLKPQAPKTRSWVSNPDSTEACIELAPRFNKARRLGLQNNKISIGNAFLCDP